MNNTALQQFLADQQVKVEQLEIDSAVAYWDAGMNSTPEAEERAAKCQAELEACYADFERYALLKSTEVPADPSLQRQRKLLLDAFEGSQMPIEVIEELARREMEIEGIFSNFRADLNGELVSDNDLRTLMRDSTDLAERQAVWRASKQIGTNVAEKVLELVEIRNREAQRQGYANYYSMQIQLQELDEVELFDLLEKVSAGLEPTFLKTKAKFDSQIASKYGIETSELRPWHYSDPFFQEAPVAEESELDTLFEGKPLEPMLKSFFDAIGLNLHDLLDKADLYERQGKNQHAYCLSAGRGTGDVRVNCNLRSDAKWMSTLLHEFGHAVYDNEIDHNLPFFLRTVSHTMTTEAIAQIMGRFVTNGAWLKRWVDSNPADIDRISESARETQKTQLLVFTQWVQVITHFERELYRDPSQDLDTLWWNLVKKYQHLTPPENCPKSAWASKIHLACSPVYYHNYLMGEMIASQLLAYLRTHVVASESELVDSPKVGQWLTEKIFRPGSTYMWNDHVEFATGEKLNPEHFIKEQIA
jgi:peptidyl-dipeptidase A